MLVWSITNIVIDSTYQGVRGMHLSALKLARNRREWTEKRAAQRLGLSQSYLAMLERGQRKLTPRLARKFKAVYGLSPTVLPTSELFHPRVNVSGEELAKTLSALGYARCRSGQPSHGRTHQETKDGNSKETCQQGYSALHRKTRPQPKCRTQKH